MTARHSIGRVVVAASAAAMFMAVVASSQGRRGGGGSGGGGAPQVSRLDAFEKAFTLDKNQKNQVKAILDDAHKAAAPIRDPLIAARAAIVASLQTGKSQSEIDAAVAAYAAQAAAMAGAEAKALAAITKVLTPAQRTNAAAMTASIYIARGIFLDPKKWNVVPDGRTY